MSRRLFKLVYLLQRWPSKLKIARATIYANTADQALPERAGDSESTQGAAPEVYFCQECNDIRLDGKWAKELSHTVEIRRHYSKTETLPDLPGLQESAARGCPFCTLLLQALTEPEWLEVAPIRDWQECRSPLPSTTPTHPRIPRLSELSPPPSEGRLVIGDVLYKTRSEVENYRVYLPAMAFRIMIVWNEIRLHYRLNFEMTCFDDCLLDDGSDDNVLEIHFLKPPFEDPLSPRAISTMKRWIVGCEDSCHPFEQNGPLPSRLIDLSEDQPRLVITSQGITDRRYATLSYCWGSEGTGILKTEKASFMQHQSGIDSQSIPKTIFDAILVARALGLRYFWVDSLCIIQDDEEDWELEASRMGEVYRNSYITIVPVDSSSSNEGFLSRPTVPTARIPFHSSQGPLKGKTYLLQSRDGDLTGVFPERIIEDSVWKSRGWTFQEEQLSRRMLMFSEDRITFRCPERMNAETEVMPEAHQVPGMYHYPDDWASLVVNRYNNRQFMYLNDKLPALSGFAKRFQQSSGLADDRYLAGHWLSQLHYSLLWTPNWELIDRISPSKAVERVSARPNPYIAPTWSWASFLRSTDMAAERGRSSSITILEAETPYHGKDPFGRITDGWLVIRGEHRSLDEFFEDPRASMMRAPPHGKSRYQWDLQWNYEAVCMCWPDWGIRSANVLEVDGTLESYRDFGYLRRLTLLRLSRETFAGLMLLPLREKGVWARMGTFQEHFRGRWVSKADTSDPRRWEAAQKNWAEWCDGWEEGYFKII